MWRLSSTLAITVLLVACRGGVTDTKIDPLAQKTEQQTANAPNRGTCVVVSPDGIRCDKRTCKTDSDSGDCGDFAKKCIDNGHYYSGTKDAGTCSRIY